MQNPRSVSTVGWVTGNFRNAREPLNKLRIVASGFANGLEPKCTSVATDGAKSFSVSLVEVVEVILMTES